VYPLSLRPVEDMLFERSIDICHETVRFWWYRFGPLFAADIWKRLDPSPIRPRTPVELKSLIPTLIPERANNVSFYEKHRFSKICFTQNGFSDTKLPLEILAAENAGTCLTGR
jgi:hypothetical protein